MIPARSATTSALPAGRYPSSLAEVETAYVTDAGWSASTTRREVWDNFLEASTQLDSIAPLAWVWLGGSFLTDKVDPDDLDVVFWIEDTHIQGITDRTDRLILDMFANNRTRTVTGLRLDTFVCEWHVDPAADRQLTLPYTQYVRNRGRWDDFWQRTRTGPKGAAPVRGDALPRRGYVEVLWNGGANVL